ncbi:MAG: hypothetical protein DMG22_11250, partial [Acidobacteria bacterium]
MWLRGSLYFGVLALLMELAATPMLISAPPGAGQANWDTLKQLSPGQEVKVVQNDAKSFQCNFQSL